MTSSLKDNPLETRADLVCCLKSMLSPVESRFKNQKSGVLLGKTSAHYSAETAEMEGFSRLLWGVFPLLAGDETSFNFENYAQIIKNGINPKHSDYWGKTKPYDQKLVEMAVYGFGLMLLKDKLTAYFSKEECTQLFEWLNQISDTQMPDSNWNYFAILVSVGFKKNNLPYQQVVIDRYFSMMEQYYLGNGWYSDGLNRPKDYYISMAFHYYGLIYAHFMQEDDPERSAILRERAERFSLDFIHLFAADGAAIPFGRSLTYRFAEAAFWSTAAFVGLKSFSNGVIKGIILRHLRWWLNKPIFDNTGILSIGYTYPNLIMAEDYNSPGSPYWAFKLFLILALPETHDFWQSKEEPLPILPHTKIIPESNQILVHNQDQSHVYMLTSGQLELNNYVNTDAKYTKFAYSSLFGFTLDRGRYGLKHASCDQMLLLSEKGDEYYRGRRECEKVIILENAIYSKWHPWHDVEVQTWLIPCCDWHIRVHKIKTQRDLHSAEGGFAVIKNDKTQINCEQKTAKIVASNGISMIKDQSPIARKPDQIITPPNSSITFSDCAAVPLLTAELQKGTHLLCSLVYGGTAESSLEPAISINEDEILITTETDKRLVSLVCY